MSTRPEHEPAAQPKILRFPQSVSQVSTDGHLKQELLTIVTPLAMWFINRYAERAEEIATRHLAKCVGDNVGEITWQLVLLAIWELQPREG